MEELVEWLRGVLADDERTAKAAEREAGMEWSGEDNGLYNESDPGRMPGPFYYDEGVDEEVLAHVARHDPAQVLADIEAKRALLDLHDQSGVRWTGFPRADRQEAYCVHDQQASPCDTVRLLARAYRHRPGWKPEWEA